MGIAPECAPPLDPSPESDVYEFNDSDRDAHSHPSTSAEPSEASESTQETLARPATPPPPSIAPPAALITSPSGRLKLTLRMKRSPVLDEVIESGSSMDPHPVYEVLRVEGLTEDEAQVEEAAARAKQQRRTRRKYRTDSSSSSSSSSSGTLVVRPTTKRLRLIFGNESHTIDLPPPPPPNLSIQ